MEKEEILNRIAEAFGAGDKEIKIAYDTFLQKISEELQPGEAVRIPGFGVFQFKRRIITGSSVNKSGNDEYQLLYFPNDSDEVVELDYTFSGKNRIRSPEAAFSLSAGKPIIPISETQKKELLIQSSYLNLLNSFSEKADELFQDAVKLDSFDVDNLSETQRISLNTDKPETAIDSNENVPWNFGDDVLQEKPDEQQAFEEQPPEVEKQEPQIEPLIDFEPDAIDIKNFSFDPFTVNNEEQSTPVNESENISESEPLEEDTRSSKFEIIDDDKLMPSSEEMDDLLKNDAFDFNNLDFNNIQENKDEEATVNSMEDLTLPEDIDKESSQEEEEAVENAEDEEDDEVVSIDVSKVNKFATPGPVPLEEVGENEVNVGYSKWFWIVLVSLIVITGGGLYYFLAFRGPSEVKQNVAAVSKNKKVQTNVIQRDYQVPVTVIPKGNDESAEKTSENIAGNKSAETNPAQTKPTETKPVESKPTENKTAAKPVETKPETKNTNLATADNNKNSKQANTSTTTANNQNAGNKTGNENVKSSKQTETQTASTGSQPGLERSDNKNTLVQNNIFTDGMKYTIQLSSWKSRTIAEKEVMHLRKQGLDAYLTQSYVPSVGETRFRVRVGEYNTLQGAESALEKIK